ncbi:MAG: hypothetical protein ACRD29_19920 [Acidimicrobiales bacterium]
MASTLITRAMLASQAAGYELAELSVDAANSTGAVGGYERLGFTTRNRLVGHAKEIPAEPATD